MKAAYEIVQDQDGSFSVRHVDDHTIATLNGVILTGLDEDIADMSMGELDMALLKMDNGHEFDAPFDLV